MDIDDYVKLRNENASNKTPEDEDEPRFIDIETSLLPLKYELEQLTGEKFVIDAFYEDMSELCYYDEYEEEEDNQGAPVIVGLSAADLWENLLGTIELCRLTKEKTEKEHTKLLQDMFDKQFNMIQNLFKKENLQQQQEHNDLK